MDLYQRMKDKSTDIHRGGLPFFRYSKLCLLQWLLEITLIVYGAMLLFGSDSKEGSRSQGAVLIAVGLVLFLFMPVINEIVIKTAACCQKLESPEEVQKRFSRETCAPLFPIVYSPGYNITAAGFEKLHPFDSTKYRRIWEFLHSKSILSIEDQEFHQPRGLPSRKWLAEVMSPMYLFWHNYSIALCSYVELPLCFLPGWFLRAQLLEPMCLGSVGSVEAAYIAMRKGWAINLSGGFHHATRSSGGGFCIYPDITFVTHYLRKNFNVKKIMIVDLDAHQGNGHERDHLHDEDTYILDAYNHQIYPGDQVAKEAIRKDVAVTYTDTDLLFNQKIDNAMAEAVSEFTPDFIVYNAGTDCLLGDELGRLGVSKQGIIDRDEIMFDWAFNKTGAQIPIVMLMSGGYQMSNAEVIADSIGNLIDKFDLKARDYSPKQV